MAFKSRWSAKTKKTKKKNCCWSQGMSFRMEHSSSMKQKISPNFFLYPAEKSWHRWNFCAQRFNIAAFLHSKKDKRETKELRYTYYINWRSQIHPSNNTMRGKPNVGIVASSHTTPLQTFVQQQQHSNCHRRLNDRTDTEMLKPYEITNRVNWIQKTVDLYTHFSLQILSYFNSCWEITTILQLSHSHQVHLPLSIS